MALLNLIQHQRQLQAREPNHLSSMVSKSRQNRHTRDNQRTQSDVQSVYPAFVLLRLYFGFYAERHINPRQESLNLDTSSDNISVSEELINSESRIWHAKESFSNSCKSDDQSIPTLIFLTQFNYKRP
ncbi:hypothetical protein YC2023_053596 [Brassica napus]